MHHTSSQTSGLTFRWPQASEALERARDIVLTPEALAFVAALAKRFEPSVRGLLARRRDVDLAVDARVREGLDAYDFLPETRAIRDGDWRVAAPPPDLTCRRVEITGPVDRKMIINALTSGADVFMADFEDATAPSLENVVAGQRHLRDAVRRTIRHVDPKTGKTYELRERIATLMVRPRGLHLDERHVELDGAPVPGSLFDFGLFFFHNARELVARGSGPYFYLPKLESHLEAKHWDDVLAFAEDALALPRGSARATVLIETLPAAFEMDEILHALREHSAGLNCGRWDYIFSFIKKHRAHPTMALPDRRLVTMEQPFLKAYSELVVRTCHRRGAHAMGGMAAFIPIKADEQKNQRVLERVRADKLREVRAGHDGTWVAHPGLVPLAQEIMGSMAGPNQLGVLREDVAPTSADLLRVPTGARTEEGLRENVRVGIQYLEAWLRGQGCVPLYDLMEDAATAEISRAQAWQWVSHRAALETASGSRALDEAFLREVVDDELRALEVRLGAAYGEGRFGEARALFERLVLAPEFEEFLTVPAYALLCTSA